MTISRFNLRSLLVRLGTASLAVSLVTLAACDPDGTGDPRSGFAGGDESGDEDGSDDPSGDDSDDGDACNHPPGWWKTHSANSKGGNNAAWPLAEDTALCDSTWFDTLWTAPKGGSLWVKLAHDLIAAQLNVAAGAIPSPEVDTAIADATALIDACDADSIDKVAAKALQKALRAFNTGSNVECVDPGDDSGDDAGDEDSN